VRVLVSASDGYADPHECGAMGYLAKRRLSPDQLQRVWAGRQPPPPPPARRWLPNTENSPRHHTPVLRRNIPTSARPNDSTIFVFCPGVRLWVYFLTWYTFHFVASAAAGMTVSIP
jgi:hypothetical protein